MSFIFRSLFVSGLWLLLAFFRQRRRLLKRMKRLQANGGVVNSIFVSPLQRQTSSFGINPKHVLEIIRR